MKVGESGDSFRKYMDYIRKSLGWDQYCAVTCAWEAKCQSNKFSQIDHLSFYVNDAVLILRVCGGAILTF